MKKESIVMVALAGMMSLFLDAGEVGKVTLNKDVYEVGEKDATVTVTDGTGGYKAGVGSGFGQVEATFKGAGSHPVTISKEPSKSRNDSGVKVTYSVEAPTEKEYPPKRDECTVVKLDNIIGVLGIINCFANFDHFYAGNLDKANALELFLEYRPEDLLYTDLPADWTLDGKGILPYIKDATEPKWKGKVPLNEESFGSIDFTAKWGTMEKKKSFTRFKIGIQKEEGEHDLWVLKDKSRTTSAKYIAKVLPDSMNTKFYKTNFDWTAFPSSKIKTKISGDRNEFCTVTPQGYHKYQTSRKEDDVQLIASWKCPSDSRYPHHTATEIKTLTVRTPVYIRLIGWRDKYPDHPMGAWREFHLKYAFFDNLNKRVPASIVVGLRVKEKWPVPLGPLATEGNTNVSASGDFIDRIGGLFGRTILTGIQKLTCDHIKGEHTVKLDLSEYHPQPTYNPPVIEANDVKAPSY